MKWLDDLPLEDQIIFFDKPDEEQDKILQEVADREFAKTQWFRILDRLTLISCICFIQRLKSLYFNIKG